MVKERGDDIVTVWYKTGDIRFPVTTTRRVVERIDQDLLRKKLVLEKEAADNAGIRN
jgi:hypothetical protein